MAPYSIFLSGALIWACRCVQDWTPIKRVKFGADRTLLTWVTATSCFMVKHQTLSGRQGHALWRKLKIFAILHHKGLMIALTKFEDDPIKTVGGVCQSTRPGNGKNCTKIVQEIQNNLLPVGFSILYQETFFVGNGVLHVCTDFCTYT